jgi:hypothetical protein
MIRYNPNVGTRVETSTGLDIPVHDYVQNTYDGANRLIRVEYKKGGSLGLIVATLTLNYDAGGNLISVDKS